MLRRKPPGKLLPSAHAVDREFRVISALHAQKFPVAEPLAYCADEGVAGTAFYVMDFVDGRVFWEPQMPGSNPAERTAVYNAMNDTIARLHASIRQKSALADFGRGENYVARQVERWSKQYRASETEKIDAMERLIDWLPGHIPPGGPARLVHGDYRLDNLIVRRSSSGDRRRARLGIVDARRSARRFLLSSDGLAHAAFGKRGRHRLAGRPRSRALGIPSMSDYVDAYVARTGLDPRPRCRSISPIISSASPRFCKASSAACATAPQPANSRRPKPK